MFYKSNSTFHLLTTAERHIQSVGFRRSFNQSSDHVVDLPVSSRYFIDSKLPTFVSHQPELSIFHRAPLSTIFRHAMSSLHTYILSHPSYSIIHYSFHSMTCSSHDQSVFASKFYDFFGNDVPGCYYNLARAFFLHSPSQHIASGIFYSGVDRCCVCFFRVCRGHWSFHTSVHIANSDVFFPECG